MLKRTPDFSSHVWEAADVVGRNAPRIVDYILKSLFPNTTGAAEVEGASRMLRTGCIAEVKRELHKWGTDSTQAHFGEVHDSFLPLVRALQRPSYFVPELDEEVPVRDLIDDPDLLDAARRFMRRKGMECLDEAERLDRLYEAVLAPGATRPANPFQDPIGRVPDVGRPIPTWRR